MGVPQNAQDAAPAYDDVFHDHPVNGFPPSGSHLAYATVPQNDDVELLAHDHGSSSAAPTPATEPESLVQTFANAFKPKPHVHCEQCDVQLAARQRRDSERHCCTMVAVTFMTMFLCALILGAIITRALYSNKTHGHG